MACLPDARAPMPQGKVYFIDDDPTLREVVGQLLELEGYEVETFDSAVGFLDSVRPTSMGCVITDVRMPKMSGIQLIGELNARRIFLPVIVITGRADVPLAVEAMKAGAIDLLQKPFQDYELLFAIDSAVKKHELDPCWSVKQRMASLTRREKEVLAGIISGLPNKAIAHDLQISIRTVEVHRANIMKKLAADNLADLVKAAMAGDGEYLRRIASRRPRL